MKLVYVVQRGLTEASRILIAAGAAVSLMNQLEQTPAALAKQNGHSQLAAMLSAASGTGHTGNLKTDSVPIPSSCLAH